MHDNDREPHVDRRYILFAIGLAAVVLAFSAVSITVVLLASQ